MLSERISPTRDMTPGEPPRVEAPIGVFDSGVGGLSIVRALAQRLPHESLFYVADGAHCPYGVRPAQEIRHFSEDICRYLVQQSAKLIVVACNTASAAALSHLRATFPQLPFVGMVPAVKPAIQRTKTGVVGVLATANTFQGPLYKDVVRRYGQRTRIIAQVCDGLVECVEDGTLDGPRTKALLRGYINPLLEAGADTLVMGCTHYAFLLPTIRQLAGNDVQLLEPSEAIARRAEQILKMEGGAKGEGKARTILATTGDPSHFHHVAERLLGRDVPPRKLRWVGGHVRDDTN
ncbi:MAG: glutamate racemase [Chloroflexota bacterium]|nr:glutamate racemase [Chloroflexota bacterium]